MWAKVDDGLYTHHKIREAARLFGRGGRVTAFGFYVAGLAYAAQHLTDGFLATAVIDELERDLERGRQLPRARDVMVAVGLWDSTDGGVQIHDFGVYNPSGKAMREKRDEVHRARSEAGKKGAEARWQK
jgi:hypothetical protein